MPEHEKTLFSVADIAKLKGKTKQAIHQLIKSREVKVEKIGNSLVIHKSELHKFD